MPSRGCCRRASGWDGNCRCHVHRLLELSVGLTTQPRTVGRAGNSEGLGATLLTPLSWHAATAGRLFKVVC